MTGTDVFRAARTLVLALVVLVLVLAPSAASAAARGGLQQLASPNDCVSSDPATDCGSAIGGGLSSARSVAVPPSGENAYVASFDGSLSTFGRNQVTGALSFTNCVKDPASAEACPNDLNRPLRGASSIVANDDYVYVASSTGNAITEFSRNLSTGQLTGIGCISQTGANPTGGTPCQTSSGLTGVTRLALSNDGNNVYAVSPTKSTLATLAVGGDGTLTAGSCVRGTASTDLTCGAVAVPGLNGANSVDASSDDLSVYVTASSGGDGNVSYLTAWNRVADALTASQCFHSSGAASDPDATAGTCSSNPSPVFGLNGADGVRTSPDDNNLYAVSGLTLDAQQGNSLVTFNRTTAGVLSTNRCLRDPSSTDETCGGTAVGLKGAFDIGITDDGQFLYVTARTGNDVAEFSRNTGSGDLTQLAGSDKCIADGGTECGPNTIAKGLTGASGIALSPDGLFVYVAAPTDSAVSEFSIERAPTCADVGPINTPRNQAVTFTLPCADPNAGDTLTCAVTQPTDGTVSQSPAGSCVVTFTPDNGVDGPDSFTYHATDTRSQNSNEATASVDVQATTVPTVTITDAAVDENAGTATFQLTLSAPSGTPIAVTYETRNGTATTPSDYTNTTGTANFAANVTTAAITVPIADDAVREPTQHFFVDLTGTSSGSAIARPTAKGTIADDDATAIGIGEVTVNENAGNANFTVTLTNPSDSTVTATYSTANGSASAPSDFTAQTNKKVSFAPGEVSKQISIPIADGAIPEQTEQFSVNLSTPTGGATLGKTQGVGTILDNDNPAMSVSDPAVAEGDTGTRNAAFTVSLSAPISRTVTVNYATVAGTATAASDYNSGTGVLTFAPGETSKTVNVGVKGDTTPESDEAFKLHLSGATEATIVDADGTGTILDDDTVATQGGLSISDTSIAEGDLGTRTATFTVSLSQASGGEVKVDYATADGTASDPSDYTGTGGTLTFAAGETSKSVSVEINGDRRFEDDETFTVTLSNTSTPISNGTGTGTIVNDDPERVRPGLTSSVKPSRDRKAPFRYTVKGKLKRPAGVSAADGCTGNVRVRFQSGGRTISNELSGVDSKCNYRQVVVFDNARKIKKGKLVIKTRFLGNRFLLAANAKTRKARAG